jgi:uncharacterized protein (TIGR01777 family)
MKKLVIAGGTGFLGQILVDFFTPKCEQIIVLTRAKSEFKNGVTYVQWDGKSIGDWSSHLEHADLLVNLTGKSVDCRYNDSNKAEILRSRIDSTLILNQAVLNCENPPKHFINSSTATIYEHSLSQPNTEHDAVIGEDFSMNVAKQWEQVFFEIATPRTIKTAIRTSIVLGEKGGALPKMAQITGLGLGGKQGEGQQMISWIHELDYARAVDFIYQKKLDGAINVTAPHPIRNVEFMNQMRKQLSVPFGLNSPKLLLKIGAFFMGTETELLLKSRFVIPQRLLSAGFVYEYATLDLCLAELFNRKKLEEMPAHTHESIEKFRTFAKNPKYEREF